MSYDDQNIFAKILRGDIPCASVYSDEYVLAFPDIAPQAPVHIIIIPKGAYTDMSDFSLNASAQEQAGLMKAIGIIAQEQGLEANGYRLISNCKNHGGQEVPHLHFHMLGGEAIGPLRATP